MDGSLDDDRLESLLLVEDRFSGDEGVCWHVGLRIEDSNHKLSLARELQLTSSH